MRAAVYLRVSSDKQARAGTIDSQRREVPARCEREGWAIVKTYADDGASAATGNLANRPGMLALLRDAEAGAFDVVAAYDLDRLTRADLLERSLILGTLARAGVQVATVTGGLIDLASVGGEITAMVQARGAADWLDGKWAGLGLPKDEEARGKTGVALARLKAVGGCSAPRLLM